MTVPADLDRRFREAAVEARLLDAGYDVFDSPVGPSWWGVRLKGPTS